MWKQNSLRERYYGIRDREGHFRDRTPANIPRVNMGSPMPREGKKSTEQQGAGDGCQIDRRTDNG